LIRNAFDPEQIKNDYGEGCWPTPKDLLFLACDEDAESRIITHVPNDLSSYELELGPFDEEEIQDLLPSSQIETSDHAPKWTLVINDVDRYSPSLTDWIHSTFEFLPTWRRDDAQFSLSQKLGGIGPHVDNYDVFLIQTQGRREWKVGKTEISPNQELEYSLPGLDVRVLSENTPLEWESLVLKAGDCLYIPPRIAHEGISLEDDGMTLSVGCRAPSASEMISKLAQDMSMTLHGKAMERYQDVDLLQDDSHRQSQSYTPWKITKEAQESAKHLIQEAFNELLEEDQMWEEWFGKFITEPKRVRPGYPIELTPPIPSISDPNALEEHEEWIESLGIWGNSKLTLDAVLNGHGYLIQAEGITFAMTERLEILKVFVNGICWEIQNVKAPIEAIMSQRRISKETLENVELCEETLDLLQDLVEKGFLYGTDE